MTDNLCNEIYKLFLSEDKEDKKKLRSKTFGFYKYSFNGLITPSVLGNLIELEKKIIMGKGSGKQTIEKAIFGVFTATIMDNFLDELEGDYLVLNEQLVKTAKKKEYKKQRLIALTLIPFLIKVFNLNLPQDTFNTQRKVLVLEVLTLLSYHYEIPEALELSQLALKSKKERLIDAAIEFEKMYAKTRSL